MNRKATRPNPRKAGLIVRDYSLAWAMWADGSNDFAIAEALGCNSRTIWKWRKENELARRGRRRKLEVLK